MLLTTSDGELIITNTTSLLSPLRAYNMTVGQTHTYTVGHEQVWVHSDCSLVKILQSGGNKLNKNTSNELNKYFGEDLNKRDWGRALEGLKKDIGLRNDFHGKILNNGDYVNDAGEVIGNISHYLP